MTRAIPYLLVKNGKKAIELYKDLFGAQLIEHQPFNKEIGKEFGLPEDFDYENSTMHAKLDIEGALIYLADNMMGLPSPGNVEITLDLENKDQIDRIYEEVKKNDFKIKMELERTFWGAWFARFEDSQGIGWQLNHTETQ
ncbi:MAG: glyoxalase/bleomycin resistance/extradiol dioxygenase family protein [Candidatus Lokiarchaeota archaeon]|nr:glyoxalase/bleomycin resistance/extradiol dioxygenase family protein [Candidatus Lokiarchaeota archaeon]